MRSWFHGSLMNVTFCFSSSVGSNPWKSFYFPSASKVGAKPKLKKHFAAGKSLQILPAAQEYALVHSLSVSASLFFSLFFYGNIRSGNNAEKQVTEVTFVSIKVLLT